jgi:methionine synthase II (cobalamin-independent)
MAQEEPEKFRPSFLATGVGTLPHGDVNRACALIAATLPRSPFWPQLPQHSRLEGMNVQISPGLPFLRIDEEKGEIHFDAGRDEAKELENVYQSYLAGAVERYRIPSGYADGFMAMLRFLEEKGPSPLHFFKGQIAGPITFGLAVQDRQGKDVIHDEVLYDGLIKAILLRGRWIIQEMKKICQEVVFFVDEPALAGYGSAFFSVDAGTILERLNEFVGEFQNSGARVGIHCCGNMDWNLLLKSRADIINFDAWGYFDQFSLYPEALGDFLSRGGVVAWGIVPTLEFTGQETVEGLMEKLEGEIQALVLRGIPAEILRAKSLLTPSCGMGLMSVENAEKAMRLLAELSGRMREKYFPAS